jgi:glycine/D-amino acid oxidase-like deaminating enzyme
MPPVNGAVSHWYTQLPTPRPGLPGDRDADVCIVGAGYTGLWTAYYLKQADPGLRITLLEARFAGFGASGRNGGWLSGLPPGHRGVLAKTHGRGNVIAWQHMLNEAVDDVIDVAAREGIDADIVKGGNLEVARTPPRPNGSDTSLTKTVAGVSRTPRSSPPTRRGSASTSTAWSSAGSTRTAPASSPPNSPAAWPTSSNVSAPPSTNRPPSPASNPAAPSHRWEPSGHR